MKEYVNLSGLELHKYLISKVMENTEEASELLDKLEKIDKYTNDYEFRANVDVVKIFILSRKGKFQEVINKSTNIIEVIRALKLWYLLSFIFNTMANAYFFIGIYEKALKHYINVIDVERKHNIISMKTIAYNNIGLIFLNLGVYEKALEYFKLSLAELEKGGSSQFRYVEKSIQTICNIIISFCQLERKDGIEEYLEKLNNFNLDDVGMDEKHSYYVTMMYYCFFLNRYDRAKYYYEKAEKPSKTDFNYDLLRLYGFVKLSIQTEQSKNFYIDELRKLEKLNEAGNIQANSLVYAELKKYYDEYGDEEKQRQINEKYFKILIQEVESLRRQQQESLQVVEEILKENKNVVDENYRNREFELIANEAVKNRNALQETYSKLAMIHEIGQKLISSLDLEEVITLINKNVEANMQVDSLVLLVAEPINQRLRSLFCREIDVIYPEFYIELNTKDSAFVRCYKEDRIISSEDEDFKECFVEREEAKKIYMRSAIYLPLRVGNRVIGAYSVQSRNEKSYGKEEIDFLKELQPYLSIALNNAVHSRKLSREITKHIKTQRNLENENVELSESVGVDPLTRISNRREFDKKFNKLLKNANKNNRTVNVFMFDIDDFKKYNDTYGHLEGDSILKKVASIVNAKFKEIGGFAARFGGEEFVSTFMGGSDYAREVADSLCKSVCDLKIENKNTERKILSISIGVVSAKNCIDGKFLIGEADKMLYKAKFEGKNQFRLAELSIK